MIQLDQTTIELVSPIEAISGEKIVVLRHPVVADQHLRPAEIDVASSVLYNSAQLVMSHSNLFSGREQLEDDLEVALAASASDLHLK